jgi:AcrR family transcriptional regulator
VSSDPAVPQLTWAERAAERSPMMQRSRSRSLEQAQTIIDAGRRLMERKGDFTTQELVKEAGVALQTFYRYFESKDQLLVAVLADLIGSQTRAHEVQASEIRDPVARLRFYVTWPVYTLDQSDAFGGARSITAEHWRLQQLFPDDIAQVDRPLVELIARTLTEGCASGTLSPGDPEHDAWLIVDLMRSVYHHYAFASLDRSIDEVAEQLWSFCLRAVGGTPEGSVDG